MNLNKSTLYALHAALDLALAAGEPVTAGAIATRYAIPENVVAKVLQQLVRSGIARSARGVGGGYRLTRPATDVTVQEIVDLFEPVADPAVPREQDGREGRQAARLTALFREVDETVRATFASVSLATLAAR